VTEVITRLAGGTGASSKPVGPVTTANDDNRTVQVVWLGSPDVERFDYSGAPYIERLPFSTCDLSRLASGSAPITDSHLRQPISVQLGVVKKAWFENGVGLAELRISDRPELDGLWNDIKSGIVRNISLEAEVGGWTETPAIKNSPRIRTATSWRPLALSLVTVPADAGAVTRSQQQFNLEKKMEPTTQTTAGAEAPVNNNNSSVGREQEAAAIRRIAAPFSTSLPQGFADSLVARGLTVEQSRDAIQRALVEASEQIPINPVNPAVTGASVTRDHQDGVFEAMRDALVLRASPQYKGTDRAREFVSMSLVDMARERLRAAGASVPWVRSEIVARAMTTSDFPALLQATGDRTLRLAYEAAPAGVLRIAKQTTARDFRAVNRLQLSEAPTLVQVNETGEYTHGKMSDAKATYSLKTFGRIVSLSRQAVINDDLQAFQSLMAQMGVAARAFEGGELVSLLTSNPTMTVDGVALFHANHKNLNATNALALAGLTTARKAMRLQTGLQGTPINAQPRWLIVPAALETVGEQVLTQLYATKIDDVNPFGNAGLSLITDPRLDASSPTTWYLATDSGQLEHLEFAYLESQQGPRIESRWGFEVDALETRISLDFGCGVVDFRGLSKNTA
jgi:hypothetical protein